MTESKEDYKDCKVEEDAGKATKLLVTHFADDTKEEQPTDKNVNLFARSCSMRSTLTQSTVDPSAPIKVRVSLLEQAVENQKERDDTTFENIEALSQDTIRIETNLTDSINTKTSTIEEDLKRFKLEVHHRFELQAAENKRLQASVATLKADNRALTKDLAIANQNLQICIKELGLDEDELSRPNTVM